MILLRWSDLMCSRRDADGRRYSDLSEFVLASNAAADADDDAASAVDAASADDDDDLSSSPPPPPPPPSMALINMAMSGINTTLKMCLRSWNPALLWP